MGRMGRRTSWVVAVLASSLLAGCSVGDPATVGPSGVDGLRIPTPSPDPADFVEGVDNPWLPLAPGSRWRYRVVEDGEVVGRVAVTVTDEAKRVAGVPVTVVRDVVRDRDGDLVEESRDWVAQDTAGNVWLFGEDTTSSAGRRSTGDSWEAGRQGAQAGLLMPATPRVGDGYEQEHREGVAEDRTRVLALDGEAQVPAGTFTDLVETEETSPLEPGLVEHTSYARGVGPVREETVTGGTRVVELVAHSAPGTA